VSFVFQASAFESFPIVSSLFRVSALEPFHAEHLR